MPSSKKQSYARYTLAALERLGQLIATERREQRITAQALAERIGVARTLVHRLEAGNPKVDLGVAFEACTILGIPLFEEANLGSMTMRIEEGRRRLALLPRYARPRQVELDDDF
ncbi:helix-turn-helix transcriptional regulator [Sphingopyxis sp. MSC1_008]|jgi:transcriptional regulator with XRE-family HTH domain|uniref:helix-turn-helix transcriptional regulator n=1 Tax=Sphingopyxis sp. MSC1_008 TaxID=2909265 RepID=UPI0020C0BE8F|nr:helix-turn-helix transcriptional regulator [Sphingopyxis sp. MSC1_008]